MKRTEILSDLSIQKSSAMPGHGGLQIMLRSRTASRKGFTLIELLVVVLILAILMAVSIPLYLSAVSDSQKKTCRANMQTISNAVAAARVKNNYLDYSSFYGSIDTAKEADLSSVPSCPSAGTYSIAAGTVSTNFKVACTAGTHGSFEPGKDSN